MYSAHCINIYTRGGQPLGWVCAHRPHCIKIYTRGCQPLGWVCPHKPLMLRHKASINLYMYSYIFCTSWIESAGFDWKKENALNLYSFSNDMYCEQNIERPTRTKNDKSSVHYFTACNFASCKDVLLPPKLHIFYVDLYPFVSAILQNATSKQTYINIWIGDVCPRNSLEISMCQEDSIKVEDPWYTHFQHI